MKSLLPKADVTKLFSCKNYTFTTGLNKLARYSSTFKTPTHAQKTCKRNLWEFVASNFDRSSCKFSHNLVWNRKASNLYKKQLVQNSTYSFLLQINLYKLHECVPGVLVVQLINSKGQNSLHQFLRNKLANSL